MLWQTRLGPWPESIRLDDSARRAADDDVIDGDQGVDEKEDDEEDEGFEDEEEEGFDDDDGDDDSDFDEDEDEDDS